MLIDSHCHLNLIETAVSDVLANAHEHGVEHMLCVATNWKEGLDVIRFAELYPSVTASVGVHPTEQEGEEPSLEALIQRGQHARVVAIGETGLDYYRVQGDITWQQERFRQHIRAAKALSKPLIVHTRNAREDTLRILAEENAETVGGVLHCFTEDASMAEAAIAMNFYISFSGIVTFHNAHALREVAQRISLKHMLIETDSPYLAPVPYRGKPNQPAYVRYVAEAIAKLHGVSVETVAEHTTHNFYRLFSTKESE